MMDNEEMFMASAAALILILFDDDTDDENDKNNITDATDNDSEISQYKQPLPTIVPHKKSPIQMIKKHNQKESNKRIEQNKNRRKSSVWITDFLLKRPTLGLYNKIDAELSGNDPALFDHFLRITRSDFDCLLEMVSPIISKQNTQFRNAISAAERLAITLYYLAIGGSTRNVHLQFRVSWVAIRRIIHTTCDAIIQVLQDDYLKTPNTTEEWQTIANDFNTKLYFPHCFGAIDGMRIRIADGRYIVLLAIIDANYKFKYVNVSDTYCDSYNSLLQAIETNAFNLPPSIPLPYEMDPVPYVAVTSDAFPLRDRLQRSYPADTEDILEQMFNIRLSRVRANVENAFGLCVSRFAILQNIIDLKADKACNIVRTICCLHNYLIERNTNNVYLSNGDVDQYNDDSGIIIDGDWRFELNGKPQIERLKPMVSDEVPSESAEDIRDKLKDYFISPHGEMSWQYDWFNEL